MMRNKQTPEEKAAALQAKADAAMKVARAAQDAATYASDLIKAQAVIKDRTERLAELVKDADDRIAARAALALPIDKFAGQVTALDAQIARYSQNIADALELDNPELATKAQQHLSTLQALRGRAAEAHADAIRAHSAATLSQGIDDTDRAELRRLQELEKNPAACFKELQAEFKGDTDRTIMQLGKYKLDQQRAYPGALARS